MCRSLLIDRSNDITFFLQDSIAVEATLRQDESVSKDACPLPKCTTGPHGS